VKNALLVKDVMGAIDMILSTKEHILAVIAGKCSLLSSAYSCDDKKEIDPRDEYCNGIVLPTFEKVVEQLSKLRR
jgi:hypothetical protein